MHAQHTHKQSAAGRDGMRSGGSAWVCMDSRTARIEHERQSAVLIDFCRIWRSMSIVLLRVRLVSPVEILLEHLHLLKIEVNSLRDQFARQYD